MLGFADSTQPTARGDRTAVASVADLKGEKNAARHMRHYLDNSGTFLTIDAKNLYQSSSEVRGHIDKINQELIARARALPQDVDYPSIRGSEQSGYVKRQDSEDWFFAMGGYTYWYTATIKTGSYRTIEAQIHFKDTYNWDQNKSTSIEGLRFPDKVLGTLHQGGVAQEYSMGGSLFYTWKY